MAENSEKKTSTQEELAKLKAQRLAKANQAASNANAGQFVKEVWVELKKTTWPDKNTLQKSTYIVMAFIGFSALLLGVIDNLLTRLQHMGQ
jgi:preprotein translocase SecE subunit